MMKISDITRNIKIVGSILTVVVTIISVAWAAEDRYAKNEDVAKVQQLLEQKIDNLDSKIEKTFIQLQVQHYRDVIDELEDKKEEGTITLSERKKLNRARTRLRILLKEYDSQ